MNHVVLTGRITKDIDLRKTPSGKSVVSFTLAVDKRKGEADFISCVAWNQTAEAMKRFLHKGSKIAINGKLSVRSFEKNEEKRYVTEVVADEVEFLDSKKSDDGLPF